MENRTAKSDIVFVFCALFVIGAFCGARELAPLFVFALSALLAGAYLFYKSIRPTILIAGLIFVAAISGFLLARREQMRLYEGIDFSKTSAFEAHVVSEPVLTKGSQVFFISAKQIRARIRVVASQSPRFYISDSVWIRGLISRPARTGAAPEMIFPTLSLKEKGSGFLRTLTDFKQERLSFVRRVLPYAQGALLEGITLGWQGDFQSDFKKALADSGTTHLVALSGYNMSLVILTLGPAFYFFLRRKVASLALVGVVALFCAVVGLGSSVVRAAIMGALVLVAKESGRPYAIGNSIAFCAFAMTLADPLAPSFDAGFQLSFASLIGLVLFEERFANTLLSIWSDNGLLRNASATLAAQTGALPILLWLFGSVSSVGVLANILLLPFVPAIMILGFSIFILGAISLSVALPVIAAAQILLEYQVFVIRFCAKMSHIGAIATLGALICFTILLWIYMPKQRHE